MKSKKPKKKPGDSKNYPICDQFRDRIKMFHIFVSVNSTRGWPANVDLREQWKEVETIHEHFNNSVVDTIESLK
jgi:hypothetical protein